jgi:hypothetical protein
MSDATPLPARPRIDHYRKRAKALVKVKPKWLKGDDDFAKRVRADARMFAALQGRS